MPIITNKQIEMDKLFKRVKAILNSGKFDNNIILNESDVKSDENIENINIRKINISEILYKELKNEFSDIDIDKYVDDIKYIVEYYCISLLSRDKKISDIRQA